MAGNRKRTITSFVYLAVLSVVIVLSCIAFLDKSLAWFSSNSRVTADGMDIKLNSDDSVGISRIRVYKVNEDNNSATLYDNPPASELKDILTLNQYDSVFAEKRENTPIIIITTLENFKSGEQAATLTVTFSLKEQTGYTTTVESKQVLMPYISNFINVCCSSDPSLSVADRIPDEYYKYARDWLLSPSVSLSSQRFVSYTGSGNSTIVGTKENTLTFSLEKPAGQTTLDVYLLLSYDENLIAKFVNDNDKGIGSVGELEGFFVWGSEISFSKDIDKISFAESTVESE